MPTVCLDWDDTLVGYKKYPPKEWIPGALDALRMFRRHKFDIVIHSCRANWPEGRAEIVAKLDEAGLRLGKKLRIHDGPGKPIGVAYVDDRAVAFRGDWDEAVVRAVALSKTFTKAV